MITLRKDNIRLAFRSLGEAKARSFLTMLGIIIGVAAVIVSTCITQGVKQQVMNQTTRYGEDVLVIEGKVSRNHLLGGNKLGGASAQFSAGDLDTIRKTDEVENVVPLGIVSGSAEADKTVNDPLVIATSPEFEAIIKHPVEYGSFLETEPDSRTIVLGSRIAHSLFEDNIPLGQSVVFRGEKFMVAGVFKTFASSPFSLEADYNDALFIPYTTARTLLGTDPTTYQILAQAKKGAETTEVAKRVHSNLVEAHGGADDIAVSSIGSGQSTADDTLQVLTLMTIVTAVIAFVVGGVGIMNVMLVSVTERTQEIGIRKAIGASNRQILRQFVTEALVLSIVGAVIGVVVSAAIVGLLRLYTSLQPVLVWQVMVLSPLVAIVIGVIFGTFPAAKASRKDPIEALRHQ